MDDENNQISLKNEELKALYEILIYIEDHEFWLFEMSGIEVSYNAFNKIKEKYEKNN